jgi:cysteine synthase A
VHTTVLVTESFAGNASSRAVELLRDSGVRLPTFAELADPQQLPASILRRLATVDPDEPNPLNLFRAHWYNAADRRTIQEVPDYLEVPPELSGVPARIIVALGNRFPLIRAHKVLAAYGCLVPRIVTGQFDPSVHRAVWPSTGNYCRGGVAISRILGCRGVAVLPEGMSAERFEWLRRWVSDPADIIRTPGSESNVKEIFDACVELERDPTNVVLNQFADFGNYVAHFRCTGPAFERIVQSLAADSPEVRLHAFVAASGSSGTLAAGDYLKQRYGSRIVAVEALECPTLLCNGFGEHNIQGIGDKHVPLIHNVMNTDVVVAVSDRTTDNLNLLFNTAVGREYLIERRSLPRSLVTQLSALGLSSICNVVAAIKVARQFGLTRNDVILTVATDGADLYASELEKACTKYHAGTFDAISAAEVHGQHLLGATVDHVLALHENDRARILNLGYFTWVEQRAITADFFSARREPSFWTELQGLASAWDQRITEFNQRTGLS